jgi:adhesin HecA-like repeat protein
VVEGDAAAQLVYQLMFSNNGLISSRDMLYASDRRAQGTERKLDNRQGTVVTTRQLTVKATSAKKSYGNVQLVGSYPVDGEGVVPDDELVLIQKGILKTMLNDRIPTESAPLSNGHSRVVLGGANTVKGPGVVQIDFDAAKHQKILHKSAAKEAAKNGLTHYYVVRKLGQFTVGLPQSIAASMSGNMSVSKPLCIYRVNVKTGKEEPIRSVIFSDFGLSDFKSLVLASSEKQVYNMLDIRKGIPCSLIMPQSLLFNDITLVNNKNEKRQKVPLVTSPLAIDTSL